MEAVINLTQGGVYLAKLDPAKHDEVGKMRPVVILTAPFILSTSPPVLFVCPLSSQSYPAFSALHVSLPSRDSLLKTSFALVEHSRAISAKRVSRSRLAQLTADELSHILSRLQRMIGVA